MKKLLLILIVPLLISCGHSDKNVAISDKKDYAQYLTTETTHYQLVNNEKKIDFWHEQMKKEPNAPVFKEKLAAALSEQFEKTGEVKHLHQIDSLLTLANTKLNPVNQVSNLLSLSSNSVKQHKFKAALDYARKAAALTDQKFGPALMMYDTYMELGLYKLADRIMTSNVRLENFDYLVRLAKYQDHIGNLDSAIVLNEKAYTIAQKKNSPAAIWVQANLGDMYGHAGRLEDSYRQYLAVLENNPNYLHALKGIAWIAYSHDNKTAEATEIMTYINDQKSLPDAHLLLAEIAEFKGENALKTKHLNAFMKEATKEKYDGMYNKYLIILYADEFDEHNKALTLAKQEVKNRATPMTYSLLAWVNYKKGENEMALDIIKEHVEGRTFEPEVIYYMGMIYAANDLSLKASTLLKEAVEAGYELGPVTTKKAKETLQTL